MDKNTPPQRLSADSDQHFFLQGYNSRNEEVSKLEAIRKAVENLPKWLNQAAYSLDNHAAKNGAQNVLSPKLRWYATKIEEALNK